ncbi:MAG: hypothetical protein ACW98D_05020 [Promethearchaeota archaeon]|jgi:hypothetical protein
MRPLERIERIIKLTHSLVHKYPEKSFGELMESAFSLLGEKFMKEYIRGNLTRLEYIQDLVRGPTNKEVDEKTKNFKNLIYSVLENVKELEKKETRVHPMLVEDDVFEELLKLMVDSPNNKELNKNNVKDQICDSLLKIWKETYTDWRFGQMLGNTCFDRLFNLEKRIYWLLFGIPDDKVLEILRNYISSGFKYSKKLNNLKLEMYSELIKDKEWTDKYNYIIEIDNYVQDMVKEYKLNK